MSVNEHKNRCSERKGVTSYLSVEIPCKASNRYLKSLYFRL